MRIFTGLCLFYKKIIIPPLLLSIILSFLLLPRPYLFIGTGTAFILLFPTIHYFTYEIRKPREYYFYYNLGLGKLMLWTTTIGLSFLTGFLIMAI